MKVELIKRVPLFGGLSKRELGEVAGIADEIEIPGGKKLTQEGATGHEFLVLVEGAADVHRQGRKVNTLSSGDFLGEIALVTGTPRTATVTTTTTSRMLVITARDFKSLLRRVPSIQLKILDAIAARVPDEYG